MKILLAILSAVSIYAAAIEPPTLKTLELDGKKVILVWTGDGYTYEIRRTSESGVTTNLVHVAAGRFKKIPEFRRRESLDGITNIFQVRAVYGVDKPHDKPTAYSPWSNEVIAIRMP